MRTVLQGPSRRLLQIDGSYGADTGGNYGGMSPLPNYGSSYGDSGAGGYGMYGGTYGAAYGATYGSDMNMPVCYH
jgi:hypothetical protein